MSREGLKNGRKEDGRWKWEKKKRLRNEKGVKLIKLIPILTTQRTKMGQKA